MTLAPQKGRPLAGLLVVDFSQFLSGPYASLRLMDLGARVIKIERPGTGDLTRTLYLSDTEIGGDSTLFHAINRSKESFAADMKDPADIAALKKLLARADVMIQNFRPGVIERLGFGWEAVRAINPRLVYASITGYGEDGPWAARPGQDLLAQARAGLMWLNGDRDQGPVPFGLAVADMLAGAATAQGILAALVARGVTGEGAHVETSLIEALVDFQFEVLSTHLNDGRRPPLRAAWRNAHAYLAAPYGVYPTADGFLAIAMTPLGRLAELLGIADELAPFAGDPASGFSARDEIKAIIGARLATAATAHWLSILEPADIWCAAVLDWPAMLDSEGFAALDMVQALRDGGREVLTTRSPLRLDGLRPPLSRPAPRVGEHSEAIRREFDL